LNTRVAAASSCRITRKLAGPNRRTKSWELCSSKRAAIVAEIALAEPSRQSPNTETTNALERSSSRCTMLAERSIIRRGRDTAAEDPSSLEANPE
jgi:hypothetical protein